MTTQENINVHIFYSWQSDLKAADNRNAIKSAIGAAALKVQEKYPEITLNFLLDEATRDVPGSPNIPQTILDKIRRCDIFIADITTVNAGDDTFRRMPNPNVMFELGYAYSHVGWGRVILLFNTFYGDVSEAPFDLDRQRISTYNLGEGSDRNKQKSALMSLLTEAIRSILKHSPDKPYLPIADHEEITRHQRNILYASRLLDQLNVPVLLEMIDSLPFYIKTESMHFWHSFDAVYNYPLTRTSDNDLASLFGKIHELWDKLLSNGHAYSNRGARGVCHFDSHLMNAEEANDLSREIASFLVELDENINRLTNYIQDDYVEIDMDNSNKKWQADRIAYDKSLSE